MRGVVVAALALLSACWVENSLHGAGASEGADASASTTGASTASTASAGRSRG